MSADLAHDLERAFHPPAAAGLDATLRLMIGERMLVFALADNRLQWLPDDAEADATFYFADEDTARGLLTGSADPLAAFMEESFRADGYLMWAFTLLSLFRAPTER